MTSLFTFELSPEISSIPSKFLSYFVYPDLQQNLRSPFICNISVERAKQAGHPLVYPISVHFFSPLILPQTGTSAEGPLTFGCVLVVNHL